MLSQFCYLLFGLTLVSSARNTRSIMIPGQLKGDLFEYVPNSKQYNLPLKYRNTTDQNRQLKISINDLNINITLPLVVGETRNISRSYTNESTPQTSSSNW